jgi:hypothetical protein
LEYDGLPPLFFPHPWNYLSDPKNFM